MRRLPAPIFNYIDGAADDEVTYRRNTASFEECDLVPNVLRGVEAIDLSVTVMGQKLAVPFYCSPTALQRLFNHEGERAVAEVASKYGRCSVFPRSAPSVSKSCARSIRHRRCISSTSTRIAG